MIPKIENTDDLIKFLEDTLEKASKMGFIESRKYVESIGLYSGLCRFCAANIENGQYLKVLHEYLGRKTNGYLGPFISYSPTHNLQIRIDWLKSTNYKLTLIITIFKNKPKSRYFKSRQ